MAKLDGQPVPAATLLAPKLTVRASTRAAHLPRPQARRCTGPQPATKPKRSEAVAGPVITLSRG